MEEAMEKAAVLIEALPYIQGFKGRDIVVKFGGSAMAEEKVMDEVLQDIVFLATVGIKPIIVHGGGKHISRAMEEAGLEAQFVTGHRVTDQDTLDIAVRVLGEEINAQIARRIRSLGAEPIRGFCENQSVLRAKKKLLTVDGKDGQHGEVDVGFVGEIQKIDTERIRTMEQEGDIVILPPIGQDDTGQLYNVNADSAAAALACGMNAEKIVFLSDVHGIMGEPGNRNTFLSTVNKTKVDNLIRDGIIQGGMRPKVRACLRAIEGGVSKAHIIDANLNHSLLLEIFTDEGVGTQIVDGSG
ncbi:MAG: acetylglutamate kinase [Candidatus Brocadiia bacterium]